MALISLCLPNCSIDALGNNILNMFKGIKLPSLPTDTFYLISTLFFCLLLVSSSVLMLDLRVLYFRDFIFIVSICFLSFEACQVSWSVWRILYMGLPICTWVCLFWGVPIFTPNVVFFSWIITFFSICGTLSQLVQTSTMSAFFCILSYCLYDTFILFWICSGFTLIFWLCQSLFLSFMIPVMASCEHCASMLLAHENASLYLQ